MKPVRHLPVASASDPHGNDSARLPEQTVDEAVADAGVERLYQVGDIARASGKTVRAIHHYEDVGLLQPHTRSKGRYRLYDETALTRVRWIGKMHDLGLSLSQIQDMIRAWETAPSAPGAMSHMRAIYRRKLDETRAQMATLHQLERELLASLEYLDACESVCDPAELVLACSRCNHHDKGQREPDLVAGIHGGRTRRGSERLRDD
jgi:MerR family transcriptional regulator, copper efflux regulator